VLLEVSDHLVFLESKVPMVILDPTVFLDEEVKMENVVNLEMLERRE
jgi:hypothetical protein